MRKERRMKIFILIHGGVEFVIWKVLVHTHNLRFIDEEIINPCEKNLLLNKSKVYKEIGRAHV